MVGINSMEGVMWWVFEVFVLIPTHDKAGKSLRNVVCKRCPGHRGPCSMCVRNKVTADPAIDLALSPRPLPVGTGRTMVTTLSAVRGME